MSLPPSWPHGSWQLRMIRHWRMGPAASRIVAIVAALTVVACGGSGTTPGARRGDSATAPAAGASTSALPIDSASGSAAPALAIGGRYETQPGTVVCPRPDALHRLEDVGRGGDAAAFTKALDEERCSPVVAGATVTAAEVRQDVARVRRAGDTATYWTLARKLTPR